MPLALPAAAQFSNPQSQATVVHNARALRPPAGARVAIVEFEDLECPDCARANPVLKEAAEKYHIPWVRHDFPLPFHTWSFQGAVDARWFDTKSKRLGDGFRDAVFAAQAKIESQDDLNAFAHKFAADHKLAFPFAVDPQGRLAQMVKADCGSWAERGDPAHADDLGGDEPDKRHTVRRGHRSVEAVRND